MTILLAFVVVAALGTWIRRLALTGCQYVRSALTRAIT